jgi:hypothetical protein
MRLIENNFRVEKLQNVVGSRRPHSSFHCEARGAGSSKETDDACDGDREATEDSEKGLAHSAEEAAMMAAMGKFNAELGKAGILRTAAGLRPSSDAKRVAFEGAGRTVSDGPIPANWPPVSGSGTSRTWTRRWPG